MNIIGISGPMGSGKSTVAGLIQKHMGFGCVQMALADPMKDFAKKVYEFDYAQLYGPSHRRNEPDHRYPRKGKLPLTPREALQRLGTEWGRGCYEDTWVEMGIRRANELLAAGRHTVVISDVRFVNEAKAIRAAGGDVWFVDRPDCAPKKTWLQRMFNVDVRHPSEKEMHSAEFQQYISHIIDNSDGLEELEAEIKEALGLTNAKVIKLRAEM